MSIFSKIFQRKRLPRGDIDRAQILSGNSNVFTAYGGDAYRNEIFRSAVDAIARNAAKLKGAYMVKLADGTKREGDARINRLLQIEPNPYMSAYDLLYKLVTHFFLYNNAFAFLQKDDRGELTGIYPLGPMHVEFVTSQDSDLYCKFLFVGGKEAYLPYKDIIHLRRNFNSNDLLGEPNTAISSTIQLAQTQSEGLSHAIKNGTVIRGIIKTPAMTSNASLEAARDSFMKDYFDMANNGGLAAVDAKFDFVPLNMKPYPIDEKLMQTVKNKIYENLGVSESIVNSTYDEDTWAAFYASTLEPIALQLSLEFTRKTFTERERAFGNTIMFENGRLQFAATPTKINLVRELVPYGLLTLNQAMEIIGLPTVPDGDKRLQTLNMVNAAEADNYQLGKVGKGGADK